MRAAPYTPQIYTAVASDRAVSEIRWWPRRGMHIPPVKWGECSERTNRSSANSSLQHILIRYLPANTIEESESALLSS
jgi:hypothetical protein